MIECALYQPDIPQNAGTILRLGACFGVAVHVIHPCGFALGDRQLRRSGMDYLDRAILREHDDWAAFEAWRGGTGKRLIALSAHGTMSLYDHEFAPEDILIFGRETAGLPEMVHGTADAVLRIPVRSGNRSLNLAVAAAIAVSEALRQTAAFPP